MRIYIAADIEGASFLVDSRETLKKEGEDYEIARRIITNEVKAVAKGAVEAGAKEIWVEDFHGSGKNILFAELPEQLHLLRGRWRVSDLAKSKEKFDAFMMIGTHSMSGTLGGIMSHTMTGSIFQININNKPFGEFQLLAGIFGDMGVPAVLVSGDKAAVEQARQFVPRITSVITKHGVRNYGARCIHPHLIEERLKTASKDALLNLGRYRPFKVRRPIKLEICFTHPRFADDCELIPGVSRVNARTLKSTCDSMAQVYNLICLSLAISSSP